MKTILYISPVKATFVTKDIALLSTRYHLIFLADEWNRSFSIFVSALRQAFFLLKHTRKATCIFVMFAGYWSFLPAIAGKLFRTPVYIILGGTDAVCFPFLDYGSLRKPLLAKFIKWSCQLATKLLPVHESLIHYHYSYHPDSTFAEQGIKAFFPDVTTPYEAIYNGFDPSFFAPATEKKVKNTFVTVAMIHEKKRFLLKGIDLVFSLARELPHCQFKLVGFSAKMLESTVAPANVTLLPFLDQAAFVNILDESRFYIQPSVSEGFPNSFCEAMLCNCIPIGSAVGAVPLIIGDTGIVFPNNSVPGALAQIKELLAYPEQQLNELAEAARKRIATNFHLERRKEALLRLVENDYP
jgi:glycosyltransferase involved in cell wall biosynthesis